MNLVIVESPAKAKTIKKYLGKDFEVLASYGHVRDLVEKEGAVDPSQGFAMKYGLIDKNRPKVDAIEKAAREKREAEQEEIAAEEDPDHGPSAEKAEPELPPAMLPPAKPRHLPAWVATAFPVITTYIPVIMFPSWVDSTPTTLPLHCRHIKVVSAAIPPCAPRPLA